MANSYDIKLPAIKATTLQGKIEEMQSYIYQMVGQLNWALNTIESSGGKDSDTYNELKKVSVSLSENSNAVDGETPQETFDRIKALIIKSADIVEAYEQKMELDFDGKYVAESDFGTYKEETNTKIALADAGIAVHTEQIQTINNSMSAMDEVVKKNTTDIKTNADAIELKADTSTTDALGNRLSKAEGELSVQAGKIDAKVSKTDGSSTSSAQWSIDATNGVVIDTHGTDKGFTVKSNGETVLEVDKDGLTVNGSGTFSGNITASTISGSTITSETEHNIVTMGSGVVVSESKDDYNKATLGSGYLRTYNDDSGSVTTVDSSEIVITDGNDGGQLVLQSKLSGQAITTTGNTNITIPSAKYVGIGNSNTIGQVFQIGNGNTNTTVNGNVKFTGDVKGDALALTSDLDVDGTISEGGTSLEDKYAGKNAVVPYYNNHNNNIDTTTLSSYVQTAESKGGNWVGTKPSGSHNGLGIIHLLTHPKGTVGVYAGQLAFDTNQNCLWFRSSNDEANFKAWKKLAYVDDVSEKLDKSGGTMAGQLKWKDNNALPQISQPAYILGIDAFNAGGTTKWANASDVTVGNADTVDGYHASDFVKNAQGTFTQLFYGNTSSKSATIPLSTIMIYKYICLYTDVDYSLSGGVAYPNDAGGGKLIPTDALLCKFNMARAIGDEGNIEFYTSNSGSLALSRSGDRNIVVTSRTNGEPNFIIGFN